MGIKRRCKPFSSRKKVSKPLPTGTFTAIIDELLSDGRGLTTVDGKRIMIDNALPGETVLFIYHKQKQQFFEGKTVEVLNPSSSRMTPKCEFFTECGGCTLQHLHADKQIEYKQQQLLNNLQKQAKIQPKTLAEPLTANHWGYRHRARLGIKQVGKDDKTKKVHIGFRGRHSSKIVPITHCEVLVPELSALLSPIANLVDALSQSDNITQVEMTAADNALSLTFRYIHELTNNDLKQLSVFANKYNVFIYLQGNEKNELIGLHHHQQNEYIINIQNDNDINHQVEQPPLTMTFMPYHFTQVNFAMNKKMLKQAIDWLDLRTDDTVLDLFCGLGNFTLPIAQRVKSVVGVEGLSSLVNWAKQNARNNNITNADFYQADLTQDTRMMTWRVKRQYNKVLIDPPRSGALEIMPLIADIAPEKICYVSCHSATLARDINVLANDYGYRLIKAGVMDMFPHTAHVESMTLLQKS